MRGLLLLLLPAIALAQPPAPYFCTHMQTDDSGNPVSCEAISWSTQYDSYTYYFPSTASFAAAPAVAASEINATSATSALTLVAGVSAVLCARRSQQRPRRPVPPP